ncbi:hypothetical protein VD0002_g9078, partial [Verticillium dahliae]
PDRHWQLIPKPPPARAPATPDTRKKSDPSPLKSCDANKS